MKRCGALLLFSAIVFPMLLSCGGAHKYCCPGLEALQEADRNPAYYCGDHRQFALDFVQDDADGKYDLAKYEILKIAAASIENCSDTTCIFLNLEQSATLREFTVFFRAKHSRADSSFVIAEDRQAQLCICGLRDAVFDLEDLTKDKEMVK